VNGNISVKMNNKNDHVCKCAVCSEYRSETNRRKELGFDDFPETAKKLIKKLDDEIDGLKFDNEYLSCIIDGTWPDADEIIKARRNKNEK
jgi:hypothetical protein